MNAHARIAVAVSFVVTSFLGVSFLFAYWASQSIARAVSVSVLFLVIIGCIHVAGYLLYVQQTRPAAIANVDGRSSFEFAPTYWSALKVAIVLQFIFGILTALNLDMGESFGFYKVALIGHWIGIFMIMARRPLLPTQVDILFVRYGIVILLILAVMIAPRVWSIIGESPLTGLERLFGA